MPFSVPFVYSQRSSSADKQCKKRSPRSSLPITPPSCYVTKSESSRKALEQRLRDEAQAQPKLPPPLGRSTNQGDNTLSGRNGETRNLRARVNWRNGEGEHKTPRVELVEVVPSALRATSQRRQGRFAYGGMCASASAPEPASSAAPRAMGSPAWGRESPLRNQAPLPRTRVKLCHQRCR